LALAVVANWSGVALAIDESAREAARTLANEAKQDFDEGRFEEAGRKFQRAYEVAKVPMFALWAARALARRGQPVAACEFYRQAVELTPNDFWAGSTQQQAQADAGKELIELQPRIPQLRIRVEGVAANEVEVAIDDVKIASALIGIDLPTDPGQRHIVGRRGAQTLEQTIDFGWGEHKEAVLTFKAEVPPPPPPPPPPKTHQRTWGWVAVAVGGAGLLTGAVTGIVVASDSGLRSDCPHGTCNSSKVTSSTVSTYNLLRNLSTAGFIVGGVSAAVGVTLLLWTPKRESERGLALWLGPGSAGVEGAF
jgi:hypothetical protein